MYKLTPVKAQAARRTRRTRITTLWQEEARTAYARASFGRDAYIVDEVVVFWQELAASNFKKVAARMGLEF